MKSGGVFMRKKITIKTELEQNTIANIWMQHLIQRIIVEQLDVHPRLQAKLLYQNIVRGREKNDKN